MLSAFQDYEDPLWAKKHSASLVRFRLVAGLGTQSTGGLQLSSRGSSQ